MSIIITSEPSVLRMDSDGAIRIAATRFTLDTLIAAFAVGATPEQIAQDYPPLDLADIYGAIAYYLRHQNELDEYLKRGQAAAETFRQQHPELYAQGARERLVARSHAREDG